MRHHQSQKFRAVRIIQTMCLLLFVVHLAIQALYLARPDFLRKNVINKNQTESWAQDLQVDTAKDTAKGLSLISDPRDIENSFDKNLRSEHDIQKTRERNEHDIQKVQEQVRHRAWMDLIKANETMSTESCENDFGFGLVSRWAAAKKEWCRPSISCYPMMQTGHGGNGDNLCVLNNVSFDPKPYNDDRRTRQLILAYRDTSHEDAAYMHHDTPIIQTRCSKTSDVWRDDQLPGWNADWMIGGLAIDRQISCESTEDKTLLIIQRDSFANLYHNSEDFFNAFLALLIAGLRPDQVRVFLADLYPWGPFESLWKHLFPDVRTAWEMRVENATCYKSVIVGIYGPASPLTLINLNSNCFRSPLVRAYARWVWSSFGLSPQPQHNRSRLLWMSRQPSVRWPERAYCDDRYFRCEDWTHLGIRSIARVLNNDAEVVAALAARSELQVVGVDFNKLPFEEQVGRVAASDIMSGPHGAGLTHLLFLPDWACVFELFIDGSEANIHFTNLATWRGLRYGSIVIDNPAPPDRVVQELWTACAPR